MSTYRERAASIKAELLELIASAEAEKRDLTPEESEIANTKSAEHEELTEKAEKAEKAQSYVANLAAAPSSAPSSGEQAKSGPMGLRFVNSTGFKSFREAHPSGVGSGTPIRIEAKGLGGARELGIGRKEITGTTLQESTGQTVVEREPGYREYLPVEEPFTFLDLISSGSTNAAYGEYAQIIAVTDNAAIVPEGELKPLSGLETAMQDSKAYTYADGFDITNQTLADDGALAAFMETRIRRHVRGVVEQKLFNGTGAGTEPEGIMTTTGTLDQAFDTDAVTTLARALDTYEQNNPNGEPQAIVMNSADIWALRLLKDPVSGQYLLGNPLQQNLIPTPWGIPLVRSNKLDVGTALVGRFDSVHFLELEALNVLAFNQHKDYAQRNMVYVRAELRGRQLFYAPREVVVATIAGE